MTPDSDTHNHGALPAGTEAPDFTLNSSPTDKLTLSDLQGQPVQGNRLPMLLVPL